MKVMASYQHDALARQCGEAVRIKEVDIKQRINNKEEYHQPGDVEMTYTKNDNTNLLKQATKTKVDSTNNDKEISDNNSNENSTENENDQRKITEYFIKNIRKEVEDTNEAQVLSTQELIQDARERRNLALNGKSKIMSCEQCDFKTTSKTLLNKH